MIYPDKAVRKAIVSLLSDEDIAVFDSEAPSDIDPPYMLMLSQQNVDYSSKNGYGFIHRITLSAVTKGAPNTGKAASDDLLNQALALLTTSKPGETVKIVLEDPFTCWMVRSGEAKDVVFTGDTESVYQKLVTLELSIDVQ